MKTPFKVCVAMAMLLTTASASAYPTQAEKAKFEAKLSLLNVTVELVPDFKDVSPTAPH